MSHARHALGGVLSRVVLIALTCLVLAVPECADAGTWYVWTDSKSDGPGTSWANAFHTIQRGVDAAASGDTVAVTDGVYTVSAPVIVGRPILLRSVNGRDRTIVNGAGSSLCFSVEIAGAVLDGFTVTNGYYSMGGGIAVGAVNGATVRRCRVTGCRASRGGGIALAHYGNVVEACIVERNRADLGSPNQGGGIFANSSATIRNCLVRDNRADQGGGVFGYADASIESSSVCGNVATVNGGGVASGTGSIALLNSIVYFNSAPSAPNYLSASAAYSCTLPGLAGAGNIASDPTFVSGSAGDYRLAATSPCLDTGSYQAWMMGAGDVTGYRRIAGPATDMGAYERVVTNRYCVAVNGGHRFPYLTWSNAATNIQVALDLARAGDSVTVSDGVYRVSAPVAVTQAVAVASVNGWRTTRVDGGGTTTCFLLGHTAASITGFTATNGYTTAIGGGFYVAVAGGTLRNCRAVACRAQYGAGIFFAAAGGLADGCVMVNNRADSTGSRQAGGLYIRAGVTARNCLIWSNSAQDGGGVYAYRGGVMENCTVAGNTASSRAGGVFGDGGGALTNCIVYANTGTTGANYLGGGFGYSCTTPAPGGTGNITDDPRFANLTLGDGHPLAVSPCIDRGVNRSWMNTATDLDGNARITDGRVDMGAYELPTPTHYVSTVGTHVRPFASWAGAATNIQAALDVARAGDAVVVSDGVYRVTASLMVTQAVALASVNGWRTTRVDGRGSVGCFTLGHAGASITGFTATNGYTTAIGGGFYVSVAGGTIRNCRAVACRAQYGAGIFLTAGGGLVENCVLEKNAADVNLLADRQAGGLYLRAGTTARNCLIWGNSAKDGGGVYAYQGGVMENCTIAGNTAASRAGGVFGDTGGSFTNCIVYGNSGPIGANHTGSSYRFGYSCTTPSPGGTGNTTADPAFVAAGSGDFHPQAASPCRNSGINRLWMVASSDADGNRRISENVVDMGAFERPGTNVVYVALNGTHRPPFLTWAEAATNIAAGVAVAQSGDTVLVGDGTYRVTAPVTLTQAVSVIGWHGAGAVTVDGGNASRCFVVGHTGAVFDGLTFADGRHADRGGGGLFTVAGGTVRNCRVTACQAPNFGGGVCFDRNGGTIEDSQIDHNRAAFGYPGGAGGGLCIRSGVLVQRCRITDNTETTAGAGVACFTGGVVRACTVANNAADCGGGVYIENGGTVLDSVITGNYSGGYGGGVFTWQGGLVRGSLLTGNTAADSGGGLCLYQGGTGSSCTVSANIAGNYGGGVNVYTSGKMENSVIYGNAGGNWSDMGGGDGVFTSCCTVPSKGTGCITADPLFGDPAAGNYRLSGLSPCINRGANQSWMTGATDFDGIARIVNATVDIGAYEATPQHYVAVGSGLHVWPFITLAQAATNLQAAVDVAGHGDTIYVAQGRYRVLSPVTVTQGVTIVSSSGYGATHIDGGGTSRGFTLSHTNIVLSGFTVTNGYHPDKGGGILVTVPGGRVQQCRITGCRAPVGGGVCFAQAGGGLLEGCLIDRNQADPPASRGGGVYLRSGSVAQACTITGNQAPGTGGGIYLDQGGLLRDSTLRGNFANFGGGAYLLAGGRVERCGIEGNQASRGGGAWFEGGGTVQAGVFAANSAATDGGGAYLSGGGEILDGMVAGNGAATGGGIYATGGGLVRSCVMTGNVAVAGGAFYGNLGGTLQGSTVVGNLATGSAAVYLVGAAVAENTVIWNNTPGGNWATESGGTFRYCNTVPTIGVACVAADPRLLNPAAGDLRLRDDSPCIDRGTNQAWMAAAVDRAGLSRIIGGRVDIGVYEGHPRHYVSLSGAGRAPYLSWADAATSLQPAIQAATDGGTVFVTNGTYNVSADVVITQSVSVIGPKGRDVTIINGGGTARGFRIERDNVLIEGFTVTNGFASGLGGGICAVGANITLRQCRIAGNRSAAGGGVAVLLPDGLLDDCLVTGNRADAAGGGVYLPAGGRLRGGRTTANQAASGAGLFSGGNSLITNSVISGNIASGSGGGIYAQSGDLIHYTLVSANQAGDGAGIFFSAGGTLRNSLVTQNAATGAGGALYCNAGGLAQSCTVAGNRAATGGGVRFAGGGRMENCVVAGNAGGNWQNDGSGVFDHSCTTPDPGGSSNLAADPLFQEPDRANYRLQRDSPCVDRGANQDWMAGAVDFDRRARIRYGTVDMGAYEATGTHYASMSGGHVWPYLSWTDAATNIQAAINAAELRDLVRVAPGTWHVKATVTLSTGVTVRAESDYRDTCISGGGTVRCAMLSHSNSVLEGFTLSGGYVASPQAGGGALLSGGTVRLCRITSCGASGAVVGAGSLLENTVVDHNTAFWAAGLFCASGGTVRNCTITDNAAGSSPFQGYMVEAESGSLFENSIIYYCLSGFEYRSSLPTNVFIHCNLPWRTAAGCMDTPPAFLNPLAADYRLAFSAACIDRGINRDWMTNTTDLAGWPRVTGGTVDIGAFECTPTHYVRPSGGHVWPYASWAAAATNIQAALDVANATDRVLFTDAVYRVSSALVVTQAVTLTSVNGLNASRVDGGGTTRLIEIRHTGATVERLTLTNGYHGTEGGGVAFLVPGGVLRDCRIAGCRAPRGAGVRFTVAGGRMEACVLDGNTAETGMQPCGGGACLQAGVTVQGCLFTNNVANQGAGVCLAQGGVLVTSTSVCNRATGVGGGVYLAQTGLVQRCVLTGNAAMAGGGMMVDGNPLAMDCSVLGNRADIEGGGLSQFGGTVRNTVIAGNYAAYRGGGAMQIDGVIENSTLVDNAAASQGGGATQLGGLIRNSILYFNTAATDPNLLAVGGSLAYCCLTPLPAGSGHVAGDPRFVSHGAGDYHLLADSPCLNAGANQPWMYTDHDYDGARRISGNTVDMGVYECAQPNIVHVSLTGRHVYPYLNWGEAATNIQTGVETALPGERVWVTNGWYRLPAVVAIHTPITVTGVSGPAVTRVDAQGVRHCFYVATSGVTIEGFTITNGYNEMWGGGVLTTVSGLTIRNCVITGNRSRQGAGVRFLQSFGGGLMEDCIVENNRADIGSPTYGGGVFTRPGVVVRNTLFRGNRAQYGGGVFNMGGMIEHCTLTANHATIGGGGVYAENGGWLTNSIIYFNTSDSADPYAAEFAGSLTSFRNCCLPFLVYGGGTVTNDPRFVAAPADCRLLPDSPCIDAGLAFGPGHDLDGLRRPLDGNGDGTALPDIGVYEHLYRAADSDHDGMPDGWEVDRNLDPATDDARGNADGDPADNLSEYIADTDPNDPFAWFRITALSNLPPVRVFFRSSTGRVYRLNACGNLSTGTWSVLPEQSGIYGRGGADFLQDTNHLPVRFYRVGVALP